jgi:hypothetical protein
MRVTNAGRRKHKQAQTVELQCAAGQDAMTSRRTETALAVGGASRHAV